MQRGESSDAARVRTSSAQASSVKNWRQWPQGAALMASMSSPASPACSALTTANCSACTELLRGAEGNSRLTPTYTAPLTPSAAALAALVCVCVGGGRWADGRRVSPRAQLQRGGRAQPAPGAARQFIGRRGLAAAAGCRPRRRAAAAGSR